MCSTTINIDYGKDLSNVTEMIDKNDYIRSQKKWIYPIYRENLEVIIIIKIK